MNAITTPEHEALSLLEIIDFKWLMAHEGHRVHVERLQADGEYARRCLGLAAASPVETLRQAAARLGAALKLQACPRP